MYPESQLHLQNYYHKENLTNWIGVASKITAAFPGAGPHEPVVYFDRSNPADMLRLLTDYRTRLLPQLTSLMVHVTGEVALSCRDPVARVSSVLLDLAIDCELPIIPVRFIGALPAEPLVETITFPVGFARQDIVLGAPIMPAALRGMTLLERGRFVVEAINAIEPTAEVERSLPPQPGFAARVARRQASGSSETAAVLLDVMHKVAAREPNLAPLAEGRLPQGWTGPRGAWAESFLSWLSSSSITPSPGIRRLATPP